MSRYTVILKSGKEFSFEALEVEIEYSSLTEEITKFDFTGAKDKIPLHVVPREIAAIYYEKLPEGM